MCIIRPRRERTKTGNVADVPAIQTATAVADDPARRPSWTSWNVRWCPKIGSGINGHQRKLSRILSDLRASVIVVEHRDRLTRFGVEHQVASGWRIVVLGDAETADDLVGDVTEVLASSCARLYGRWSASRRAVVATGTELA